jgi:AcrR family transcriptional regulator
MSSENSATRPYRGVNADERRAERRARLIEAGYDVLADEGAAHATMKAVRIRSGLTERYFYESFRDLDELLTVLVDTVGQEIRTAMLQAVATAANDPYSLTRAAVDAAIEVLASDPRKARVYREATRSGRIKMSKAAYIESLAEALAERARRLPGLQAKRHRPALYATTMVLLFGLAETTTAWLDGDIDLTRDELAERFARICAAAIGTVGNETVHPRATDRTRHMPSVAAGH